MQYNMKSVLSLLFVTALLGFGACVDAFMACPAGGRSKVCTTKRLDTRLSSVTTQEPDIKIFTDKTSRVETVTLSLLSFDGGGIKGAMSTRLLAFALQLLLQHGDANTWTYSLVKYVESFRKSFPVMWTVRAQQLDSLGIEPQVLAKDGLRKKNKWMDFSFDEGEEQKMIESMLKVDLAYEYYLAYVL